MLLDDLALATHGDSPSFERIAIGAVRSEVVEMDNGPWLLPIVEAFGSEYLVDIEQREFRQFREPANIIKMHSERGRGILRECLGQQWHSFGLDTMGENSDMVGERCGNRLPAEA